ncbi:ribonuclease HII [Candidatus Uhrbacteria bacterium]|nr:ribonuclease HII [Candidatus Uhrbacteria bacterium]
MHPNFYEEKKLWRTGYRAIAGVDEVGYGAWAGPVVAGAVILSPGVRIPGVRDSKQLSPRARSALFPRIIEQARAWSVGIVAADVVDRIGVAAANHRAMRQALVQLSCTPDIVLIDAIALQWNVPCHAMPDGDGRVLSIAAASIVAKVWRDHLMLCWQNTFPIYGFGAHKGYGTKEHERMIRRHGLSVLHRRSFVPERCISRN